MKKFMSKLFLLILTIFLVGCEFNGLIAPKGVVTFVQRKLFFDSAALILIVVIPVIIMSLDFVYHYRKENHDGQITKRRVEYKPNWSHNNLLEIFWWGIPCLIIFILASITWYSTYKLDPYREFNYPGKLIHVQVVALPWKWLFIYPDYNIATINHLVIPNKKQISLKLTTDNVPMSAFFIPQLGSQIYTMAGMQTKLHLIATHTGNIQGLNTQYNGDGFSGMKFSVDIEEGKDFTAWVKKVQMSKYALDSESFSIERKNEKNAPIKYYSSVKPGLFHQIIKSYNAHQHPTWQIKSNA